MELTYGFKYKGEYLLPKGVKMLVDTIRITNATVTQEQFNEFVEVQEGGEYNMMSPEARMQTTLNKKEWLDVIKNYDKYASMYKDRCGCSSC